jgi:hypothetical protein
LYKDRKTSSKDIKYLQIFALDTNENFTSNKREQNMSRLNTVVNFLNELKSDSVKSALGSLSVLLTELEEKNDPEPLEMEIVDVSYQLFEKLNLLEAALRKYKATDHILTGNKLDDLYGRGSSSFDK